MKNSGHVCTSSKRKTWLERAATAKLIAAAPEMLEALQYVLSGISRIPDDVMDTITNAIRKATQ